MVIVVCTYINGYISTDGSDLRVRVKGEVNVGIVSGVYRDESGRTKQGVDERYKKGVESGPWMIQGKKKSFGGLAEGNWYEMQSERKRGTLGLA